MRSVTTIQQARALKTHSISLIRRDIGKKKIEALIKVYLIQLNELLDLARPMTEAQIDETAAEIIHTHYSLTMADVALIMKRATHGHYGEYFERLAMPKILKWFSDYFEERCDVAATASLDLHSNTKEWNDQDRVSNDKKEINEFKKAHDQYLTQKELSAQKKKDSGKR